MNEHNDEEFLNLLESGAVEISGIDTKTGDMLYRFTDNLKDIDPTLYNAMTEAFYKDLLSLWEKGYLSMDITLENPIVSATQKAIDSIGVEHLSDDEKSYLEQILKKMSTQEDK